MEHASNYRFAYCTGIWQGVARSYFCFQLRLGNYDPTEQESFETFFFLLDRAGGVSHHTPISVVRLETKTTSTQPLCSKRWKSRNRF